MDRSRRWAIGAVLLLWLPFGGCTSPLLPRGRAQTVEQRVAKLEVPMEPLWKRRCLKQGVSFPPQDVVLTFVKDENRLRLFAKRPDDKYAELASWKVLAASGDAGPKLRQGDGQVPEGVYPIWSLNPNSQFHLSLHVGYPNDTDRAQGAKDKRGDLGGAIMIHGSFVSIGCIAIGDSAIEELFYLAAVSPFRRWRLVSVPTDLRLKEAERVTKPVVEKLPWMAGVYLDALERLKKLP